jgi:hypothetical protein
MSLLGGLPGQREIDIIKYLIFGRIKMSREITIPTCMGNPVVVMINDIKYVYPAGETMEVPDEVATIIEMHEEWHTAMPPAPSGGGSNDNLGEFLIGNTTDLVWNNVTEFPSTIAEPLVEIIKNSNITSARLPALQKIPDNMFFQRGSLTSVDISKATEIGKYAFRGTSLTSVDMPEVTSTATTAFAQCTKLASVNIPKATEIGGNTFAQCTNLTSVDMPNVISIANRAFHSSGITSVNMPKVTTIGINAFGGCLGLTYITFKGTPSSIADDAFSGCTNLKTINVPWAEGEVGIAPWGATNATIVYNYKGE